ncbi:MAG: hypothetical protein JST85_23825 [Acidobacteria bacterium]|nr:hypothetical protein [Acidobacteriota bacterium]
MEVFADCPNSTPVPNENAVPLRQMASLNHKKWKTTVHFSEYIGNFGITCACANAIFENLLAHPGQASLGFSMFFMGSKSGVSVDYFTGKRTAWMGKSANFCDTG